jgi:F0F1-type ATP synthase membrane subunit b/b'
MAVFQDILNQLGVDHTFVYLFFLIMGLYFTLSVVYLKPFQNLLLKRKENTEGAKKQAQALLDQAEKKLELYKARLKDVRSRAQSMSAELHEEAKTEEAKILGEATTKAKSLILSKQKELENEKKSALALLEKELPDLSSKIAEKILGRPVASGGKSHA